MRKLIVAAAFLASPVLALAQDDFAETMAKATAGALTPLQMPDGSKLWRFAGKLPKGAEVEMRVTDLIAQALGRAQWCSNGWEETKRHPPTMGITVVEGRCL